MKAQECIEFAFTRIGRKAYGQPLSGDALSDGLALLNDLLDKWQIIGLYIHHTTEVVQSVTGSPVTVGAGGTINVPLPQFIRDTSFFRVGKTDYPLEVVSQERFNTLQYKDVSGLPRYVWLEHGSPLSKLHFYPKPSNMELHLRLDARFTKFTNYDEDVSVPPGYESAFKWSLAERLCAGIKEVPALVRQEAINARAAIKENNVTINMLDCNPFHNGNKAYYEDGISQ